MAETADRTAEAMVQSYAELSWLRRSVDDARARARWSSPRTPRASSPRRAARAAAAAAPRSRRRRSSRRRPSRRATTSTSPAAAAGALAPPPLPAAVFQCDHACGFTGAYDAVADHERTCTFQPGRAAAAGRR
ncbi:hypothetical protein JL721_4098 [Aureococcus anophagefferens]|nr:hypothetical protein JL721_4098 [Aureococcus anophagefferens]